MKSTRTIDSLPFVRALRALPASGSGSFENLVRDLLSRATARRFTLAKAGPQGGIDNRTGSDRHATVIGVETKRYGSDTRLPFDETKSKLRDAATEHADLDLWILAASREIKEPDRSKLVREGDALGLQVLIFDWPDSDELLPPLQILAAAHADVLSPYQLSTAKIDAVLLATRQHPSFAQQLGELLADLNRPELGYANARHVASEQLRENMASMRAAAARIGRYANLNDPSVFRIDRPVVRRVITEWWDGAGQHPVLALLGSEGMGKTWATLSWWLDRELADNPLPLTLVVPAKHVATATPEAVIGQALYGLFGSHDSNWWARRAKRWCANATSTRIVVILDGLNERFEVQNWATLCAELMLAPWKGGVSIVLSDRGDHWRHLVASFAGADIACVEYQIGPFSEEELDQILGRAGLDRQTLDDSLIRLLKVPRLCALALRHWEKLGKSGDITPERLIYEDFRDRVFPELGDDEMRNVIATVGEQIRESRRGDITVLRRHIREALSEESGAQSSDAAISEIVSGIWFTPTAGEPNKLRINPDLAPMAIGLALARAVQNCETAAEVSARIEAFVDDLRGLELGVAIVGIAASFMTIWPKAADVARDTLLATWLSSDNFADVELKRYTRLVHEAPDFFIDRTEAVWRDRQKLHDDRNVHLAGLVNAAEAYGNVSAAFVERATLWMGEIFGWRDAMNGREPPAAIAGPAVRERAEAWNLARGDLPALTIVEPAEGEDWVSVAGSTISAISYLPRAAFAAAIGAYAVAMTLTRQVHFKRDHFPWLLRANIIDWEAAATALVAMARRIAAVDHQDAKAAADLLLANLGSLDPAAQPGDTASDHNSEPAETVIRGDDGLARWQPDVDLTKPDWGDRALRRLGQLPALALDPAVTLYPDSIALIGKAFESAVVSERPFYLQDGIRAVLARWAPEQLADFFASTDGIAEGGQQQRDRIRHLQATWVVHDHDTTEAIASAFAEMARTAGNDARKMDTDLVVLHLADCTATEQYAAFAEMPFGPLWPTDSASLLKAPTATEFKACEAHLAPGDDHGRVASWLGLLHHSDLTEMPSGYAPVAALFGHADERVRTGALRVAGHHEDHGLANILRDQGWQADQKGDDESVYGSVALAHADPAENDDRATRVVPIALGYLARQWPDVPAFTQAFADRVRQQTESELLGGTRQGYGRAFDDEDSYRDLVERDPYRAELWVQPALEGSGIEFADMMFSAQKATIEIARALIDIGRPSGVAVLRSVKAGIAKAGIGWDAATSYPFRARLNPVSEAVRLENLAAANLDEALHDIASALQRRGEQPWLIGAIRQLMRGSPLDMGKALVLAAGLEQSPDAEDLWSNIRQQWLPRWLSRVRTMADRRYTDNIRARDWLVRFCATQDPLAAFSAFELFTLSAGRACTLWASALVEAARPTMSERAWQHWLMNVPELNSRLRAGDNAGKNHLAYMAVPTRDLGPWRA